MNKGKGGLGGGGLVDSVPAFRPPDRDSNLGASPQCGLRGGRSHCTVMLTNNVIKNQSPRWAVKKL